VRQGKLAFSLALRREVMPKDSIGNSLMVGDKVKFRSVVYTIESFGPKTGRFGTSTIKFREEQHTPEIADEISVD
jgi:hypothetical protein